MGISASKLTQVMMCSMLQRWRGQAREYRQKQLLSLDKPKHSGRLYVPDIGRGIIAEDASSDPQVHLV